MGHDKECLHQLKKPVNDPVIAAPIHCEETSSTANKHVWNYTSESTLPANVHFVHTLEVLLTFYIMLEHVSISQVPLSLRMASTLKDVHTTLYGTSSYSKEFTSATDSSLLLRSRAFCGRHSTLPTPIHHEVVGVLQGSPLQEERGSFTQPGKDYDRSCYDESCAWENEIRESESCCDLSGEDNGNDESVSDADGVAHGHMICVSDYATVLPSHVIITNLSDLPTHFKRVTSKYTRNRCPMLPCYVPYYLHRKHQLLPSTIVSLTTREECREMTIADIGAKNITRRLPHLSCDQETNKQPTTHHKKAKPGQIDKLLPHLEPLTEKVPTACVGMIAKDTTSLLGRNNRVRKSSKVAQHLGLRFKTDAHTRYSWYMVVTLLVPISLYVRLSRYHYNFSDRVPDLRPAEPSKRHTFFGYHTSVFRG